MEAFKKTGGRLLRIALLFVAMSLLAMILMTVFTAKAMADMKEIALTQTEEGEFVTVPITFYTQLIDNMKLGTVMGSLAGVLIAIVARYGLRETAKSIGDGMAVRSTITTQTGNSETTVSDEVESK